MRGSYLVFHSLVFPSLVHQGIGQLTLVPLLIYTFFWLFSAKGQTSSALPGFRSAGLSPHLIAWAVSGWAQINPCLLPNLLGLQVLSLPPLLLPGPSQGLIIFLIMVGWWAFFLSWQGQKSGDLERSGCHGMLPWAPLCTSKVSSLFRFSSFRGNWSRLAHVWM